jgi:transposase-like protein
MLAFRERIFRDEAAARSALEAVRWPNGPICPHCGSTGDDVVRVKGKGHRSGLFYCDACSGQFTVTVGTAFERSKIPLSKWWLAAHLLTSSKKGISGRQMHRTIGVSYKTAWFMMHRLREAMRECGAYNERHRTQASHVSGRLTERSFVKKAKRFWRGREKQKRRKLK